MTHEDVRPVGAASTAACTLLKSTAPFVATVTAPSATNANSSEAARPLRSSNDSSRRSFRAKPDWKTGLEKFQ